MPRSKASATRKPVRRKASTPAKKAAGTLALLVGTRKGAFILRGDKTRRTWDLSDGMYVGNIVHHMVMDPRDGAILASVGRASLHDRDAVDARDLARRHADNRDGPPLDPRRQL